MNERWLPVPGFEITHLVSNHGRVMKLPVTGAAGKVTPGMMLSTPPDGMGYPQVNLYVNGSVTHTTVHVIELRAFAGPCPAGQESRHLNDVKTDNRWPENLCWGTPGENQGHDRLANGTSNRGERHGMHRLTEDDVHRVRLLLHMGKRPCDVATIIGCSRQAVNHIQSGRRWGWLETDLEAIREALARV